MCGLVGFCDFGNRSHFPDIINAMNNEIKLRGPDSRGEWIDVNTGLHLAHRRLAIQDLSPLGAQPMHSKCGRYVMVYNGEIYNHLEIRRELLKCFPDIKWAGFSDSETLLSCLSLMGLAETLKKVSGMFAFSLYDKKKRTLVLARDRMGEKPLYWGWQGKVLFFSSELKALKKHPGFIGEVDRNSLSLMMRHNYVPAPFSIYTGISKLEAGHYVEIPLHDFFQAKSVLPVSYWRLRDFVNQGFDSCCDDAQLIDSAESLLLSVIKEQMLSDAPVGAFLSGGVDSSLVAALMQEVSVERAKTFTIGFDDKGYNEAEHAKNVADYLGTDHTEIYVSPKDAINVIPSLPDIYCEPFSDSSQIPTYLVSRLASQNVKVCLTGDGADEIFGGYNRYLMAKDIWSFLSHIPFPVRMSLAKLLRKFSPTFWDRVFECFSVLLPGKYQLRLAGEKVHKLASVMQEKSNLGFYRNLTSHWKSPDSLVLGGGEYQTLISNSDSWSNELGFQENMMVLDSLAYLPDDIFVKVDRAAMSNSLETRAPFVDRRIVEFALGLPMTCKIREANGKWLLRQILYRHVPKDLVERPKMGFGVPLGDWLRGPLRDWAESLLSSKRVANEGFFNPSDVSDVWQKHLSGKRNYQHLLWNVLMFQAWHESQ